MIVVLVLTACAGAPSIPEDVASVDSMELPVDVEPHLAALSSRVPRERFERDAEWLVAHPDVAMEPLLRELTVASKAERAAIVLGRIGRPEAVPALTHALRDSQTMLASWQAAVALAKIPGPDAERQLVEAAALPDAEVAGHAVSALAMRVPPSCDAIRSALGHVEGTVRYYALKGGAKAGCLDAATIARMAEDPHPDVAKLASELASAKP